MLIRALTDEELKQVDAAKQAANDKLKGWRQALSINRKTLSKIERTDLKNKLTYYTRITGKPVLAVVDDSEIFLDYDLLKRFTKTLDRQKFSHCVLRVEGAEFNKTLTIYYGDGMYGSNRGIARLCEIPPRQRELLHDLPRVVLAGQEQELMHF